jgi:hypothetical protein
MILAEDILCPKCIVMLMMFSVPRAHLQHDRMIDLTFVGNLNFLTITSYYYNFDNTFTLSEGASAVLVESVGAGAASLENTYCCFLVPSPESFWAFDYKIHSHVIVCDSANLIAQKTYSNLGFFVISFMLSVVIVGSTKNSVVIPGTQFICARK